MNEASASADPILPLLKWPGGKRKLVPTILAAFPPRVTAPLHEPFVGSAAVALGGVSTSGSVLADINPRLIQFHRVVRDFPSDLHKWLQKFPVGGGWADRYASIRTAFNEADAPSADGYPRDRDVLNAARFLWLNKAGFNGLYRENSRGEFNVPPGSYGTVRLPSPDAIRAVSNALKLCVLRCQDWRITVLEAPAGARLYVDPPYGPISKTAAFTTYSRKPFTWEDQISLAEACAGAAARGVHVVASNHGTDRILELWERHGFHTRKVAGVKRSISCKGSGRAEEVPEVLFTSWASAPNPEVQ